MLVSIVLTTTVGTKHLISIAERIFMFDTIADCTVIGSACTFIDSVPKFIAFITLRDWPNGWLNFDWVAAVSLFVMKFNTWFMKFLKSSELIVCCFKMNFYNFLNKPLTAALDEASFWEMSINAKQSFYTPRFPLRHSGKRLEFSRIKMSMSSFASGNMRALFLSLLTPLMFASVFLFWVEDLNHPLTSIFYDE